MPKATVAIEDRRFYSHGGIDPQGIARAVWADVKARKVVQGGSTITQQLVRNLYISNERTVQRKLKEACLAIKLNDAWSKQRILATYLNQVYYGNLAYGIEAAAQTYFSKPARALNLREAALLAGLTQAPSAYDPFVETGKALARRNEVLSAMRDQGMITADQYTWARRSRDLQLKPGRLYKEIREPYFFGYVRDQLIRTYGAETVRSGGLSVYTTIVPRWQRAAQEAIRETLTEPNDPAAAVISIDPGNGAIRAMTAVIPGRRNNQFNLLSQARRQPGSTFKTFVLAAAIDKGIDPDTSYYVSAPFTYQPVENGNCDDGSWWCVKTYDSTYDGWTSVSRATLALRQHRLRAAHPRRRARPSRRDGAQARRALAARGRRPLRAGDGPRLGRRVAARHGVGLRDPRRRRRLLRADGDPQGRAAEREGGHRGWLGLAEANAGDPRRRRLESDPDPRGQRQLRHRHASSVRPARRRQDRHHRQARGRLVRRLHTRPLDRGLDGLPGRRDPDGERPRHRRLGRELPGPDLAAARWSARSGCGRRGSSPSRRAYPQYQPFQRGPLALGYDPYYVASTDTTGTDTTSTATTETTPPDTPPAETTTEP